MEIRVRLGRGLARFAPAPMLKVELPVGATVDDLYASLAQANPDLAPALRSALPIVRGTHVEQREVLSPGDEVALLTPVAGG
jgi:molybdopterin synthase sulfur carrier subunit